LKQFKRLYGLHVRRQVPIGPYFADFAIQSRKIIIEVDGEFHALPERQQADMRRDKWLKSQGYSIIRITTGELSENFDGCIETILRELGLA
jgi:very-short-patch-repair endonuclease